MGRRLYPSRAKRSVFTWLYGQITGKAELSAGKAWKPELIPLDTYRADPLNPAVNRERQEAARSAKHAQEGFAHGTKSGWLGCTLRNKLS